MSTSATSGLEALLLRLGWSPLFALESISLLGSHQQKCQSIFNIPSNISAHTVADDVVAMMGRQSGAAREAVGSPPINNTCSSCANNSIAAELPSRSGQYR
jgi:hypothetical protein